MSGICRGRELVFCHACENEFYKDDPHGLSCPACESTFTEIIDDDNDPREDQIPEQNQRHFANHNPWANPRGPDDEDIPAVGPHPNANSQQDGRPTLSPIFQAVGGLINLFASPNSNSSNPSDMPTPPGGFPPFDQQDRARSRSVPPGSRQTNGPNPNQPHIHIYRSAGPGFTFTATTSTMRVERDDQQGRVMPMGDFSTYAPFPVAPRDFLFGRSSQQDGMRLLDPLHHYSPSPIFARPSQSLTMRARFQVRSSQPSQEDGSLQGDIDGLGGLLHSRFPGFFRPDAPLPNLSDNPTRLMNQLFQQVQQAGGPGAQPGFPPAFANLFTGGQDVGMFASSEEAFQRILANLHAQHPTTNAPGPAPEAAIAALPRVRATPEIFGLDPTATGNTADCSVCMDTRKLGDEVVTLPCKHWFCEDCATSWLKEHDTCPQCREGIVAKEPDGTASTRLRGTDELPAHDHSAASVARSQAHAADPIRMPESPTAARRRHSSGGGGGGGQGRGPRRRHDGNSGSSGGSGGQGLGERFRGWLGGSSGSSRRR